jgi:transcriptional regulator with XRE-family HTH domain
MKATSEEQFIAELGKRIASERQARGITQEQLAADVSLDRVAIAYIETGKRKPKVTSIYKIAKGLGVDVEELFKGL